MFFFVSAGLVQLVMESFVEDFQGEGFTKSSDLVVTIDGPSGAGKGTLAGFIADVLSVEAYSAGDFFRELAAEKDLTVEELSEKADKETDLAVDRKTLEKGLEESCVIESRIASWVLGSFSDFKIYVTADLEERARRTLKDLKEGDRKTEEQVTDLEKVKQKIKKRDEDNRERYKHYYSVDTEDKEIYDLIIDNTDLGLQDEKELVRKALKKRFPERTD